MDIEMTNDKVLEAIHKMNDDEITFTDKFEDNIGDYPVDYFSKKNM